jgi:hypothetical protein
MRSKRRIARREGSSQAASAHDVARWAKKLSHLLWKVVLQEIAKEKTGRDGFSQTFLQYHSKQLGNQHNLTSHITFVYLLYLSFAYYVHHLELDCSLKTDQGGGNYEVVTKGEELLPSRRAFLALITRYQSVYVMVCVS